MAQKPIWSMPTPALKSPLWFSFDSSEEDKDLWLMEQEITTELERIEHRHTDTLPIGKSGHDQSFVEEEEEEDEEEDDNDDEESEERDDDSDEDMIEDVDDVVDD